MIGDEDEDGIDVLAELYVRDALREEEMIAAGEAMLAARWDAPVDAQTAYELANVEVNTHPETGLPLSRTTEIVEGPLPPQRERLGRRDAEPGPLSPLEQAAEDAHRQTWREATGDE